MKNFVKAMDKNGDGFLFLKLKFPKLNDAKIKEGIFVGPQIRKLCEKVGFKGTCCLVVEDVCEFFLGNYKADHYKTIILLKN
jgi:hypothetical protein